MAEEPEVSMTGRNLVLLDLALLALMILASRLALVIHEVGGHAVPAWALGAKKVSIRLSTLGGGYVTPQYAPGKRPTGWALMAFDLGGIALNLGTGVLAWVLARRMRGRGLVYAALLLYGSGSVAGGIVYLSNGFYYGSGDPVGFAPETNDIRSAQWVWILFLPPACAVAWLAVRHYLDFLPAPLALWTPRRRLGWLLGTVGIAGICYGGLWMALRNPDREGSTREWRFEQEIAKEVARRTSPPPQPSPPPGAEPAPPPSFPAPSRAAPRIVVRPEEVKHRVPSPIGPWVLYGAFASGILVALWTPQPRGLGAEVRAFPCLCLAALAAGAALGFYLLG